ncbi:hypothetical protein V8F20_002367 [Naviculisporaceae sp. PSN 640]
MCFQIDDVFTCRHRSFGGYDYCAHFGKTGKGAGGNHKENSVPEKCKDCLNMDKDHHKEKMNQPKPYEKKGGSSSKK